MDRMISRGLFSTKSAEIPQKFQKIWWVERFFFTNKRPNKIFCDLKVKNKCY